MDWELIVFRTAVTLGVSCLYIAVLICVWGDK
jgi:hypothetical protein